LKFESRKPFVLAAALSVLAGLGAPAAAQDPVAVFRSDLRLVVLHATVLDQDGNRITNLPESAFHIFENGVEQQIRVFRREDSPVSIGLLIDDSGSMVNKRQRVAAAALSLVKASNPGDEVFILHFNEKSYLDTDYTNDTARLTRALETFDSRGTTAMRDAMRLAIQYSQRKASEDKKVLVVITDGEDNASSVGPEYVVRAAQQSGVLIYAVGLLSEIDDERTERARRDLDALTHATGGQAFYLDDVSKTDATAREIAREIRDQYTLAYTSTDPRVDGAYRKIELKVTGPGQLAARTRSGYYATGGK
jgi:Ca-activated chloride channel family protein